MIQINTEQCIGCGLCAYDCFPGAITCEGGKAELSVPENCIGCGHCVAICPKNAVSAPAFDMEDISPAIFPVSGDGLLSVMKSRRSCRHFKQEVPSEEMVRAVIEAARYCPTAKNLQNTRYIVVRDMIPALLDAALEELGKIGEIGQKQNCSPGDARRFNNFVNWASIRKNDKKFDPLFFRAPVLLLFVSNVDGARDAASAAAYGELMAAATGLGCLYSGYFTACAAASGKIQKMLRLREDEQVVRCLVLGYPDVKFQRTAPRKAPDIAYL